MGDCEGIAQARSRLNPSCTHLFFLRETFVLMGLVSFCIAADAHTHDKRFCPAFSFPAQGTRAPGGKRASPKMRGSATLRERKMERANGPENAFGKREGKREREDGDRSASVAPEKEKIAKR